MNERNGKAAQSPSFVSVVIVNYNGCRYLERCLGALARQTRPVDEILVVDNASADSSAEWVTAHSPDVRLIMAERNLGFAAGNNLGIRTARGDWVATLNNDTEVEPDYIEKLVGAVEEQGFDMGAPLMLEFERRDRIDAAGIELDWAGFAWNCQKGQPANAAGETREVWGPCAGAALYRRSMLNRIGIFDEDFFAFYEDVDLAWRARRAGYRCLLVPQARVYHVHGGSFRHGSPQKLFLLARNRWWTLFKNYGRAGIAWRWPLLLAVDFLALVRALAMNQTTAPLRGRIAALQGAGRMMKKKRDEYARTG